MRLGNFSVLGMIMGDSHMLTIFFQRTNISSADSSRIKLHSQVRFRVLLASFLSVSAIGVLVYKFDSVFLLKVTAFPTSISWFWFECSKFVRFIFRTVVSCIYKEFRSDFIRDFWFIPISSRSPSLVLAHTRISFCRFRYCSFSVETMHFGNRSR